MKTIVIRSARDLHIEERTAQAPEAGQVRVHIQAGGICGSDLHYFNHGGFGSVRLKEPMILGHEVSGKIAELGPEVHDLKVGQLVAVSPSRPCGECSYCTAGHQNHCPNMRFYGSAMPFPHIQGAFREHLVVDAAQCAVADGLSAGEAAMAEPLSVVLHGAQRAGDLMGKRVLVTGCGPIGMLAVLVARAAGAVEIVATDVEDFTLAKAKSVGADSTHNVATSPNALAKYAQGKGHFDILFECSGVAAALSDAVSAMKPRGIIMQLGLGGDMTLPVQAMTAKELELRGSFRFHSEFFTAVDMMRNGRLDVKPLITHTFALADAVSAFEKASDRSEVIKAQIAF